MDKIWGTPGQNANAFTISVAFFGLSTLLFGNWIERHGPFWSNVRTLFFTPAGWALAALGSYTEQLGLVYLGFGVFHGIGAGHGYISATSMIQKWYPDFKGLATGYGVMGFGVGSFICTTISKQLMDVNGPYKLKPYEVQGIFAAVYLCALAIVVPFMRNPPPDWKAPNWELEPTKKESCLTRTARSFARHSKHTSVMDHHFTFLEAVSTLEFRLICLLVLGQFIAGVVFLSSAADMVQNVFGRDSNDANFITSMLNLVNFSGRAFFGYLSDKIGRKTFYLGSTLTQAFALGLMSVWIQQGHYDLWLLSFLLIGSLYGGGFGVLPALLSDTFGPRISGATHGVTISVWALSSIIGIPIFTSFTSKYIKIVNGVKVPLPQAYIYNSYWLCGFPVMAFICLLFLNLRPHDRILRQHSKDIRVRFFQYLIVFKGWCSMPMVQNPAQQEAEWEAYSKTLQPISPETTDDTNITVAEEVDKEKDIIPGSAVTIRSTQIYPVGNVVDDDNPAVMNNSTASTTDEPLKTAENHESAV